jgi:hypothetical protein
MSFRGGRRAGMVSAIAAVAAGLIVIVGCGGPVSGSPTANKADAAAYSKEAASSSAAATSARRVSDGNAAAQKACDNLRNFSKAATVKYNDFISASDANAPDVTAKAKLASDALKESAQQVETASTDTIEAIPNGSELRAALAGYVSKERALADAVDKKVSVADLNAAAKTSDGAKDAAVTACNDGGF